jgi:hypothetical protein
MSEIYPQVLQAVPGDGYIVYAYMLDGSVRRVDVTHLIEKGGVFEALKDRNLFENALTVLNDTVAWDLSGNYDPTNCIDIDPFTIADCPIVDDPLADIS